MPRRRASLLQVEGDTTTPSTNPLSVFHSRSNHSPTSSIPGRSQELLSRVPTRLPLMPLSECFPADAIIPCPDESQWHLIILGYESKASPLQLLYRVCYIATSTSDLKSLHCAYASVIVGIQSLSQIHRFDLLPLLPEILECLRVLLAPHIVLRLIYVSHPWHRVDGAVEVARRQPHKTVTLMLSKKARDALYA